MRTGGAGGGAYVGFRKGTTGLGSWSCFRFAGFNPADSLAIGLRLLTAGVGLTPEASLFPFSSLLTWVPTP